MSPRGHLTTSATGGCYWPLAGRGRGCWWTSYNPLGKLSSTPSQIMQPKVLRRAEVSPSSGYMSQSPSELGNITRQGPSQRKASRSGGYHFKADPIKSSHPFSSIRLPGQRVCVPWRWQSHKLEEAWIQNHGVEENHHQPETPASDSCMRHDLSQH